MNTKIPDTQSCTFSDRHKSRGGVEHRYQGGQAIRYYGEENPNRDLENLKNAVILEFPSTGIVEVSGSDSERLLHLLLTQDIARMPVGSSAWSSSTNREGRILSDMRVWRLESDRFLLLLPPGRANTILNHIQFHIVAEDVGLKDLSDTSTRFVLAGERIAPVLNELRHDSHISSHDVGGIEIHTAQGPELGIPCRDILVPRQVADRFMDEMELRGTTFVGTDTYNALRIEKGLPLWGVDANESCIPNEAGFTESIGFGKGCFLGYEVINRVFQMGLRSKLMGIGFLSDTPPPTIGAQITSKQGLSTQITSLSWCPKLNIYAGLALIPTQYAVPDTELWAESCDGPKSGKLSELPFSDA